jgi:hypothetical protein
VIGWSFTGPDPFANPLSSARATLWRGSQTLDLNAMIPQGSGWVEVLSNLVDDELIMRRPSRS